MKGIVLAAGKATRLYPSTKLVNKTLLPIYNKPLIYYPIATLMLAGIRDILLIISERDLNTFQDYFGDGSEFGVRFSFAIQKLQKGIADAFIIGEEFIDNENVCLILGDNIFYHPELEFILKKHRNIHKGATVFAYPVADPERFGVIEINSESSAVSLVEKPKNPKSNLAVTGLYFYDNSVVEYSKNLKPSARGELEITDINKIYLGQGNLNVEILSQPSYWIDAGTPDSIVDASLQIREFEKEKGIKLGYLEKIAFKNGWIEKPILDKKAEEYKKCHYGLELVTN